jgi:hypothetical protein
MSQTRTLETARWMVEFYHQWDSFTRHVNWRDFTIINIEGEWNHSWPLVEVRVVLLGLGIRVVRQLHVEDDDITPLLGERVPNEEKP